MLHSAEAIDVLNVHSLTHNRLPLVTYSSPAQSTSLSATVKLVPMYCAQHVHHQALGRLSSFFYVWINTACASLLVHSTLTQLAAAGFDGDGEIFQAQGQAQGKTSCRESNPD